MDDHRKELANRLFAKLTAMLEDATQVAAEGQSSRSTPSRLRTQAHRLQRDVADIAVLVEATRVLIGKPSRTKRPK